GLASRRGNPACRRAHAGYGRLAAAAGARRICRPPLPRLNPKPMTEGKANRILPFFNVKTSRLWRAILPLSHPPPERRLTVTIGRRELLVALGATAVAWPLAARAQPMPVIGFLNSQSPEGYTGWLRGFRQGLKDAETCTGATSISAMER